MRGIRGSELAKTVPKARSLSVLDCFIITYVAYGMERKDDLEDDWFVSYPSNYTRWMRLANIASKLGVTYDKIYGRIGRFRESGLIRCQDWSESDDNDGKFLESRLTVKGVVFLSSNIGTIKHQIITSSYSAKSELEKVLDIIVSLSGTNMRWSTKSETKIALNQNIGIAVAANEKEIRLAVAALILQIDAKLEDLRNERPNSEEAIAERSGDITEYEHLHAGLEDILEAVSTFKKGTAEEANLVRSLTSFADGIKVWWNRKHDAILTKTFDMGLFTAAVGICSMAGTGGKMAVTVSAVLVGGKPVAQALKGLIPKRFMAD